MTTPTVTRPHGSSRRSLRVKPFSRVGLESKNACSWYHRRRHCPYPCKLRNATVARETTSLLLVKDSVRLLWLLWVFQHCKWFVKGQQNGFCKKWWFRSYLSVFVQFLVRSTVTSGPWSLFVHGIRRKGDGNQAKIELFTGTNTRETNTDRWRRWRTPNTDVYRARTAGRRYT